MPSPTELRSEGWAFESLVWQGIPYVLVGHSVGTWMLYEFLKMLISKGIPLPKQVTQLPKLNCLGDLG